MFAATVPLALAPVAPSATRAIDPAIAVVMTKRVMFFFMALSSECVLYRGDVSIGPRGDGALWKSRRSATPTT